MIHIEEERMFPGNLARQIKVQLSGIAVISMLILLVNLMSCGSPASTSTTSTPTVSTPVTVNNAKATLQHTPTGNAQLTYNATAKTLVVSITMTGLAPNSTHPTHIHQGSCAKPTKNILYSLNNVIVNGVGQGSSTTTLHSITSGIPATGWFINVHNGPTLQAAAQSASIACGTINNPNKATTVTTMMGPSTDVNENATGRATLTLANGTMTVNLYAQGLAPNSSHAAHIHAGSCNATKGVLYNLSPLVANAQGVAQKTISFKGVKGISTSGWAINIHDTTDLSTQTGYNPILCGNVVPA
jgi:CHRD domain